MEDPKEVGDKMGDPKDSVEVQDEVLASTESQEKRSVRWFLLEMSMSERHVIESGRGVVLQTPLPILIQVYYPGRVGKYCHCYYEVLACFWPALFHRTFNYATDKPVNVCVHIGRFVELEEVVQP
jgi:hypothetical protein